MVPRIPPRIVYNTAGISSVVTRLRINIIVGTYTTLICDTVGTALEQQFMDK